jgi:hypothetical protein
MEKECKKCHILFDGANRYEYCIDCYWIKRREDMKIGRLKYKHNHSKENLGNERQDGIIMKFLRKKRQNDDKRYHL